MQLMALQIVIVRNTNQISEVTQCVAHKLFLEENVTKAHGVPMLHCLYRYK